MTGVLQSGSITPGHNVRWTSDGVIGDGGSPLGLNIILGTLLGADFNSTLDQEIVIDPNVVAFQLFRIYVTRSSASLTTAVGGFYPQANKAGTPLVANTQLYSSLTTAASLLSCTLAGNTIFTRFTTSNLPNWKVYLSLTTPQGTDATADVYVLGTPLAR